MENLPAKEPEQNASSESDLEARLITELKLNSVSATQRAQILEKSLNIINTNVVLRIMDELSEQDKDDCDAFLEKEGANIEAMMSFCSTRLPNLNLIIVQSVEKTLKEIKAALERDRLAAMGRWLERATKIHRESERRKLHHERMRKIFMWVGKAVGWVVGLLVCYALASFFGIPLDGLIPGWVQRIFR